MVNYWKSKVLPKIKKVFGADGKTRLAASEACKTFDESKEKITKEFEEKKGELGPKVLEIYEASTVEIKSLVKKPTDSGLKKNSAGVTKFFEELVKIEFPGSKPVSEVITKFGPVLVSGPVVFIFEKVCTFVPADEPAAEVETREINVEEVKKEMEAEKKEEAPAAAEPAPTSAQAADPTPASAKEPEKASAAPAAEPAKELDAASAAVEPAKPAEPAPAPAKVEEPAKPAAPEPAPAKAVEPAKPAAAAPAAGKTPEPAKPAAAAPAAGKAAEPAKPAAPAPKKGK